MGLGLNHQSHAFEDRDTYDRPKYSVRVIREVAVVHVSRLFICLSTVMYRIRDLKGIRLCRSVLVQVSGRGLGGMARVGWGRLRPVKGRSGSIRV